MHNLDHYSHFTHKAIRHVECEKIFVRIPSVSDDTFAWTECQYFTDRIYSPSRYKQLYESKIDKVVRLSCY